MKKIFLIITLTIFSLISSFAQTNGFTIKGKVLLQNNTPASSANVSLLSTKDSSLVKAEITTKEGTYQFSDVKPGSYIISVTYSGYAKHITTAVNITADATVEDIMLNPSTTELGAVTVRGQRPIIEQKFDKLIFNVSGNITAAGNSALEVLEKAPGVTVSQSGAISLGGRPGVLILIDGKRTHLSEADLAAYLRGLPASAIDRIDLISNPSAQYEAEGTSGIIDIRLKKDERMGYNGSLNLAYIYGTGSSGNGSLNFNYRNKSLNIFGTLSKSYNDLEGKQVSERRFYTNNSVSNGSIHTDNTRQFYYNNNNVRIGADYFLNKKTIMGVVLMGSLNNAEADYHTRTDNFYPNDSSDFAMDRSLNINNRNNAAFNFNIKRTVDTTGKEWNFDFDYAVFSNRDDIDVQANFYNKQATPNRPFYNLVGDLNGNLNVYSTRFDYQIPKFWGGTLQLGFRSSLVKADNDLLFFDYSTGTPVIDLSKSNRFLYSENINAIYANYQMRKNKLSIQAGLRVENTNGKGEQVTIDDKFDRSYIQPFPNVFVGYDVSKNYNVGLSFSRRIDRPSYNQLNPFRFYGSPFGYTEGNPLLSPQLTYVAELSSTFYKRYIARFSYSITNDVIAMTWGLDPVDMRISAQKPVNLNNTKSYRFSFSAPVNVQKWLTSFNNVIAALTSFEGEAFNTDLDRKQPWFYISSNNTFRITKTFTAELNAAYRSSQIWGFQRMVAASSVSVGFGKQVLAGKGNLRFNVSDIFKTAVGHGVTTLDNYVLDVKQWNETRRATLSFTYNFGKSKVAAARNRTSSSEEERARAGN